MTRDRLSELTVTYKSVHALTAFATNARTHSKHQIRQIASSIEAFGFNNPILIDEAGTIIAGHGRVQAAKLLRIDQVPTIQLSGMSKDEIRAYILADNQIALKAGWDESILSVELQHLITIDANLDITITGFEIAEVDLILSKKPVKPDEDDTLETNHADEATTRPGDLWILGQHRILCGNSLNETSFKKLMGTRRANAVFADPPFNIKIQDNVSGHGSIHHGNFAMASGEMSEAEFIAFLTRGMRLLSRYSTNGSVHFVCMDWRHAAEMLTAGKQIYEDLLNICVWSKDRAGLGSFYRSRHEFIFVFKSGTKAHRNNIQLGRFGRDRSNIWEYPAMNTPSKQSEEGNLLAIHPTVKPVKMIADAILDCSARGAIVLDSFLGSGTTVIAAERVGRICFGIEIDPLYVDAAVRRWQRLTGGRAIHAVTGEYFDNRLSCEATRGE